jgi:hypothetical protein
MLGREQILKGLVGELTKTSPSHRSIVGARFSGKSVILKELATQMRADKTFCAVIEWDLGHLTPNSEQKFISTLCKCLGEGLKDAGQHEYGDYLLTIEDDYNAELSNVIDSLDSEGLRVLMIWDGFDKPLSGGKLGRNLWDNMRELCLKEAFRLVTATRRNLHDLIRDEKSVTSDFWNIFGDVVRVGPFDSQDIESIITNLNANTFLGGAKTEIANWSGGNPPLLLALLNNLNSIKPTGEIDNSDVQTAADSKMSGVDAILKTLWSDCSPSAQDLYVALIEKGDLPLADTGTEECQQLIEKGFAVRKNQKISASCRLLEQNILGAGPDTGSMSRLFGDWDSYLTNIRSFLERRLSHITSFDSRLFRLVARAIEDIPDYPDDCLNNLNGIRERALNIVLKREFGTTLVVSQEVKEYWTDPARNSKKIIKRMMEANSWVIPNDPATQLGILEYLTGSHMGFESKAQKTSKDTYVLLNAIHGYRNRNQHADGQDINLGVAVAAMMSCIELLACLEREQ